MFSVRLKTFLLIIFHFVFLISVVAQNDKNDQEVLNNGIQILKNYFFENNNWHVVQPEVGNNVDGLLHFIEDQPIDSIVANLNRFRSSNQNYVLRLPEDVEDSLSVPGYISAAKVRQNVDRIKTDYENEVDIRKITVPASLIANAEQEVEIIPPGKGIVLFNDSVYVFPDSLIIPDVIPDSILNTPEEFDKLVRVDSIRNIFIEQKRQQYNDSIKSVHVNIVIRNYRQQKYDEDLKFRIKRYRDSVKINNYSILTDYNNKVIAEVNDSINSVIEILNSYADFIDTARISIINLAGESKDILLQNGNERYARVWLKNEQNDSLRVMVKNTDKRSMQMLIDDGVTFSRFKEKQTKDFDFSSLKRTSGKFAGVKEKYAVETPWTINGDGNVGLTQTYLENWKKGGKSALSSLLVLKGEANYSRKDGKVKWENSAEIRNGWIKPGGEDSELQKNDDKFEFTSRFGLSAFKKWYYSTEFNFNTQFFRGYNYPTSSNPDPLSAFLAPAKSYIKLGLDYKPNNNFSVFLSPLSLKNVYVRDTTLIDQTTFGVDPDRKSFWEPGLNADVKLTRKLTNDITYVTKYSMFMNYKAPFSKFDVDWENTFKVQLTDYINLQFMLHLIYDDDVKFPVYDDNDVKIGEKSKLQVKELFTIGFAYSINRKVVRTHRVR